MNYRTKGYLVALLVLATTATSAADDDSMLTYDEFAAGYFWSPTSDPDLSDLRGFGLTASWSPRPRLFLSFGHENIRAHTTGLQEDRIQLRGTALVGTIGTWFELSQTLHMTAEIGADRERYTAKFQGLKESATSVVANAVAGVRWAPLPRLELSGELQRLQDLDGGPDSRWVVSGAVLFKISGKLDLGANIGLEDGSASYIAGLRYRF